jgi:hypothetical protein
MSGRDALKPWRGPTVATEDIRERLAQLPHHAVVAFAARWARRVQPLTHVLPQQDRDAIDRALASAEEFAKGAADARAAHQAADAAAWAAAVADAADAADRATVAAAARAAAVAADVAADADAARAAANAAADAAAAWAANAAAAAARAARAATSRDLDRLIALNPGEPDALGAPIDPSEAGPLGPLWPQGVPEWDTEAATGTGTPHEEPSGDAD